MCDLRHLPERIFSTRSATSSATAGVLPSPSAEGSFRAAICVLTIARNCWVALLYRSNAIWKASATYTAATVVDRRVVGICE